MPAKLKIAHKGLILVAVPLAFELLFVGILFALQQSAELEAQKQARAKDILAVTGDLTRNLVDASTSLAIYRVTRSDTYISRYDEIAREIPKLYERLNKLTATDPSQAAKVVLLENYSERMLYLTSNFRRQTDPSILVIRSSLALRHEIEIAYRHYIEQEQKLAEELKTIQNPTIEQEKKNRFKIGLVIGIIINIALTAWSALFFSRNITRRLAVLTDNNLRLSRHDKLHEPLSGDDEIADLDNGFHAMAEALATAQQRKQEFVQMISHDLRTPLSSIQGTLAAAARGIYGQVNEKGLTRLSDAEASAESLINMINELLDIEKIEAGMMQIALRPTSLSTIVEKSISAVRPLAEKHAITINAPASDCQVECDEERLARVLTNLLSNAVKYSPDGSTVTISEEHDRDSVTVKVTDQGQGIPAGAREKIFDRFQQVELADQSKGSGLGLAICKAIVEAHQGTIGVTSEPGTGSTFWFTLPR
ncbi:MAG TPA: ATP-binding protein [Chroococcales cyanobacterium]